jgi:Glycosyltransferase family 87
LLAAGGARLRSAVVRDWAGDVLLYAMSAVLAAGLAIVTVYHGHRLWGVVSTVAYTGGAVVTMVMRHHLQHRHRMVIAGWVFALSALVPLAVLVVQRVYGVPWSAQPEVEVMERMARLMLATGTPYADIGTLHHFRDYAPYLPAMAVFGTPRAVFGDGALTDARLVFFAVATLLVLLAVRLLGTPRLPVHAVLLAAVLPATTLTAATGGDDLPVLALLVVCLACCHLGRVGAGGVAGGLALAMKLTAAPVLLVLAGAVHAGQGARRAALFTATALGVAAALVLPVALVSPTTLVEHVIRFPAGLTDIESPAASPLPGYLLAKTGEAGHVAALVLLALAALAVLVWVLRRPPCDAAQAADRAAVGLVIAMLLMPATRFGYLIYPLVLAGTAVALRSSTTSATGHGVRTASSYSRVEP